MDLADSFCYDFDFNSTIRHKAVHMIQFHGSHGPWIPWESMGLGGNGPAKLMGIEM